MNRNSLYRVVNSAPHDQNCKYREMIGPCTCDVNKAEKEYSELQGRVKELELALQCANVLNYMAEEKYWHPKSDFGERIEKLIGKPPYGEHENMHEV